MRNIYPPPRKQPARKRHSFLTHRTSQAAAGVVLRLKGVPPDQGSLRAVPRLRDSRGPAPGVLLEDPRLSPSGTSTPASLRTAGSPPRLPSGTPQLPPRKPPPSSFPLGDLPLSTPVNPHLFLRELVPLLWPPDTGEPLVTSPQGPRPHTAPPGDLQEPLFSPRGRTEPEVPTTRGRRSAAPPPSGPGPAPSAPPRRLPAAPGRREPNLRPPRQSAAHGCRPIARGQSLTSRRAMAPRPPRARSSPDQGAQIRVQALT